MKTSNISQLREHLSALIKECEEGEIIVIHNAGKPQAMMMGIDNYIKLSNKEITVQELLGQAWLSKE